MSETATATFTPTPTPTASPDEAATIHWVDICVIVGYFVIVFATGFYFGLYKWARDKWRKYRNSRRPPTELEEEDLNIPENQTTSKSFFLAGKGVGWFAIGCSLFASNIGSEHFIGLASSGAKDGICVSFGEWTSILAIILLGWLFVPYYLRASVYTLPEFIEKRFSKYCRMYLTIMSLIMYVLTKISVALFAGSIVFRVLLGWNIWVSASVLVVATGIYTVSGGLSAVIYTEVAQTFILVVGGVVVFIISMVDIGGWSELASKLPSDMTHLWQPVTHHNFPWTGVVFGMPFVSIWYWCTDQVIVQRVLSANGLPSATRGCLMAGFLKILPPFMMVVPGMISRVMFQSVRDDPNTAFIVLVQRRLPMGARGIMIAAMLAALMSSLASVFHSSSTLFTMDIYRVAKAKYLSWKRTRSGERDVMLEDHVEHTSSNEDHSSSSTESSAGEGTEYVLVGRIAGIVVTLVGVLWIPLVQLLSQQLYIYTHKVMSYTAPPIAVVFLFGILWKRANAYGALTVMLFGFVFGMSRLILEAIVTSNPNMIQDSPEFIATVLTIFVQSNFLHFSACFTLISSIIMIIVSLVSPAPSEEQAKWTITVAHMKAMFSKGGEEVEESPIEHREETSRWSFIKKHSGHIINLGMTGVLLAGVVGLYTGFA